MAGECRFRVRYAESDQMGLAHHGAYVTWFEAARIEWLRDYHLSYRQLEIDGIMMPVVTLNVTYKKPLRFDDELVLRTTVAILGRTRIAFTTAIFTAESATQPDAQAHAIGEVVVACVGKDSRPIRVPQFLIDLIPASSPDVSKAN